MRRTWILLLAGLLLSLISCGDWSLSYSEQVKDGGWNVALDREHRRAFAAEYVWEGDMSEEGRRIVIPETVEDCIVRKLGGYYGRGLPMPFSVVTPAVSTEGKEIVNPEDPRPLVFTLVVNKSLQEIGNVRMASSEAEAPDRIFLEDTDGKLYAYDICWRAEAEAENKTFYVKDGKLYQRSGDKLVTAFYWEK